MDPRRTGPRVFLFPWLAYGHISPFLQLAKKLSRRGSCTYLCSTPVNLKSVEKKVREMDASLQIQLVELHLPSLPELPPSRHTTNGLPRHLVPTLMNALRMAKPALSDIINSQKPDLIIHDLMFPGLAAVAASNDIPAVQFSPAGGATSLAYFIHTSQHPETEFPPFRLLLSDYEKAAVQSLFQFGRDHRRPQDDNPEGSRKMMLMKTSREIEGKCFDYLSELSSASKMFIPVGPLVEDPISSQDGGPTIELLQWLGKQEKYSTVFLSFGSEYYLKKEEIQEIAYGLELSQVNFIWVIRFPEEDDMTVEKALPEGFLAGVGDRGKVVGWAPQLEILDHRSTGGFVSHCGWNSALECVRYGVPLIAMPMHLEQPLTAKLMVEIGVAVEVQRDDHDKFRKEEIAKAIKGVIFGDGEGKLREQVREVGRKVKNKEEEEMDEAYEQLLALINSQNKKL